MMDHAVGMPTPEQARQRIREWVADSVDAIPDDVMKAARDGVSKWPYSQVERGIIAEGIARAIMAERERCASIASHDMHGKVGKNIAAAIRKGEA